MKLYLENFRCFSGVHTFDINDLGITLITGVSGVGKSSIIMAIFFALTDKCATNKIISHNASSCTVKLEFKTWNIVRTRGPKRLLVMTEEKRIIEEAVAQTYIDNHFGKHFEDIGYIPQLYTNSFLFRKPLEKLEILERICFENIDPIQLKDRCALQLKQLQSKHNFEKGKHSSLKHILENLRAQNAHLELPKIEEPAKNDLFDLQNTMRELDYKEAQLVASFKLDSQIKALEDNLDRVVCELDSLSLGKDGTPLTRDQDQLERHIQLLLELQQLQEAIASTQSQQIWSNYSREECEQWIEDYSRDIRSHMEFLDVSKKLKQLSSVQATCSELENKKFQLMSSAEAFYACPQCKSDLKMCNGTLLCLDPNDQSRVPLDQKRNQLKKIEDQLQSLKAPLKQLEGLNARHGELIALIDPAENVRDLKSDLEKIQKYFEENKNLEMKRSFQLERLKALELQLKAEGGGSENFPMELEDARNLLTKTRKHRQLMQEFLSIEKTLKSLHAEQARAPMEDPKCTLEDLRRIKSETSSALQTWRDRQHQFELYQIKHERHLQYQAHLKDLEEIESELKRIQIEQGAVAELKQMILRCEAEFIDNKIAELNQLINHYTSLIFLEPISVTMQTTKRSTYEDKVQVQIEIFYKNMNCDLGILSGGEQARLNLAFMLAFAQIFHSPLILLDECTSHLDQEMTEMVLELIQNSGIPKVILIAHQIVEGNFEQIMNIK